MNTSDELSLPPCPPSRCLLGFGIMAAPLHQNSNPPLSPQFRRCSPSHMDMPPASTQPAVDYADVFGAPPTFVPSITAASQFSHYSIPDVPLLRSSPFPLFDLPAFGDDVCDARIRCSSSSSNVTKPSSIKRENIFEDERHATSVSHSLNTYRDHPFVGSSWSGPSSRACSRLVSPVHPAVAASDRSVRLIPFSKTSFADFLHSRTGKATRRNFFSSVEESKGMTCKSHSTLSRCDPNETSLTPTLSRRRHLRYTQSVNYRTSDSSGGFRQTELVRQISALDHNVTDAYKDPGSWITINDLYKSSRATDPRSESQLKFKSWKDWSATLAANEAEGSGNESVLNDIGSSPTVPADERSTKHDMDMKENLLNEQFDDGMFVNRSKNKPSAVSFITCAKKYAEMEERQLWDSLSTDSKLNEDRGMKKNAARFSLDQVASLELKGRESQSLKQRDNRELKTFVSQKNRTDKECGKILRLYSYKEKGAVKVLPTSHNSATLGTRFNDKIELRNSSVGAYIPFDVGRPTVTVCSEGHNTCNGTKDDNNHETCAEIRALDDEREHKSPYSEKRQQLENASDRKIKRWATGKEGNLRALLCNLQHVLWIDSGWVPIPLTCLIEAADVRKAYRKATLFVHPDKLQQKSATLQQKYIAGKVFDILQEAWKTFNTQELF